MSGRWQPPRWPRSTRVFDAQLLASPQDNAWEVVVFNDDISSWHAVDDLSGVEEVVRVDRVITWPANTWSRWLA
jgi:hypothetical protein